MSLEEKAELIADHLREQEYVEVYGHHDADGIAAAAILCHGLYRLGIGFRLRIAGSLPALADDPEQPVILCDMGSGSAGLPDQTIVIDHHTPGFPGTYHLNPNLFGFDGEQVLPASGCAYMVAAALGDNRDLAGLALLGMIGDQQLMEGPNRDLFNEGVGNGVVSPERGLLLPGRTREEQLLLATSPYLAGISGDEEMVRQVIAEEGQQESIEALLSAIVFAAAEQAAPAALERLYGDQYGLQREVIEDGHTLAAVIDGCGKAGMGGLAASLCLRSPGSIGEAWAVTARYRQQVIAAIRGREQIGDWAGCYTVPDLALVGDVADALLRDLPSGDLVVVVAAEGASCRLSVRTPLAREIDLGRLLADLAPDYGGTGGGHRHRGGATIRSAAVPGFIEQLKEALV